MADADDLVRQLQAHPRDEALWTRFYRALYPLVYYSAYKLLRGHVATAQDIAQEAFERFLRYQSLAHMTTDRHALAHLRQTARRLAFDRWRLDARTHAMETRAEQDASPQPMSADPEEAAAVLSDLELLATTLSASDQSVLSGVAAGHSLEDIGATLGVTSGAVAVRLHRLRKLLAHGAG